MPVSVANEVIVEPSLSVVVTDAVAVAAVSDAVVPVSEAVPLLPLAVELYATQSAAPALCAWMRSVLLQEESRQETAELPMALWEAQAQAWSEAGVQTAAIAVERQGTCETGAIWNHWLVEKGQHISWGKVD